MPIVPILVMIPGKKVLLQNIPALAVIANKLQRLKKSHYFLFHDVHLTLRQHGPCQQNYAVATDAERGAT